MSAPQFYAPMPPAGQYPAYMPQQQSYYPPPPYQQQATYYPQQPQYMQPNPPYPQQYYPQQYVQPMPMPQQQQQQTARWQQTQPSPAQTNDFRSQPTQQAWDPKKIWEEQNGKVDPNSPYNNPTEPMYGKPNDAPDEIKEYHHNKDASGEQPAADGERGLGAMALGGAGGAFLGHKMEHGMLGTLGGLAVGAVAAEMFEKHHEKEKKKREEERSYDDGYRRGEHSERRDIDDDYYRGDRYDDRGSSREMNQYNDDRYGYDDDADRDYYEPPHHSHHHHHRYQDEDVDSDDYYQDDRYSQGGYYDRF